MIDEFRLEKEDYEVIRFTKKYIRNVLRQHDLTPKQIIGFGNYLHALERLPLKTPGVDSYIELTHFEGNFSSGNMKAYGFRLSEDLFHVEVAGYIHSSNGGDSIAYPDWYVEAGGGRDTDAVPWELEDELSLLTHLGVKIKVEDYSEINYFEIENGEE